jgi:hypothetical protein
MPLATISTPPVQHEDRGRSSVEATVQYAQLWRIGVPDQKFKLVE